MRGSPEHDHFVDRPAIGGDPRVIGKILTMLIDNERQNYLLVLSPGKPSTVASAE